MRAQQVSCIAWFIMGKFGSEDTCAHYSWSLPLRFSLPAHEWAMLPCFCTRRTVPNVQRVHHGVTARKAWWRSSFSSEGSLSKGPAGEDLGQVLPQSPRQDADLGDRPDDFGARMYRSKSDPMRSGRHVPENNPDDENRRRLSVKTYDQWLKKKDKEALDLEEERIRTVRRARTLRSRHSISSASKGRLGSP